VAHDAVIVQAPAKINLVLRVGPRRPDGYHEVLTLMAALDLADVLAIAPAPATVVRCAGLPAGDTLVTRALIELCTAAGHAGGFRVRIDKRIPVGAGLGGGSSDAGAALLAANRLLPRPLDAPTLQAIAAGVGSDVPFFLGPPVAVARGRGERLAPGPDLPSCTIALAHPGRPLATRDVYDAYVPGEPLPAGLPAPSTIEELAALVANDLGPAAEALEPACRSLREGLVAAGALAASVTGSGSAVFGVFREAGEAERALGSLRDAAWTGRATLRAA
jgi:4-diphosphocytidyl-2-C-methyl-D-erythritol kinase